MMFLVTVLSINTSNAQVEQDSTLYSIETDDGNEFLGTKVYEDSLIIKLKTQKLGEITIQKSNIKNISKVGAKQIVEGQYWFENPQAARYFYSPNSYGLRKGEGYYQNVWIFFNQVSFGITDNITIGTGVVPLFLFGGAPTPAWITPKFSIPIIKDKFNISAGALVGTVFGVNNSGFGILYGNATIGSRDKNFSLGLGWGYSGSGDEGGNGSFAKSPTVSISGMVRTSKKWYFITENYYIDAGGDVVILLSAGARVIIKKVSLDFGLVAPIISEQDIFIAVPWLGFVVPFGSKAAKQRSF